LLNRRQFISAMAAATAMTAIPISRASSARLTHKERVDRALRGEEVDRPPFSLWHHYKRPTAELEAQDHLAFHRRYDTDFVKIMNDFDYPRSTTGKWYELQPLQTPYPEQLRTLELVRDGLHGDAYFIDTLYGPYMTAMLLLAAEPEFAGKKDAEDRSDVISRIHTFQKENTAAWEGAMEAITQSTINHIHRSQEIGCSGTLVSIFNATSKFGSVSDYEHYSRPYDKRVLAALADTKLTLLHLHTLERPYLEQFKDFSAPVINYSVKTSGIPIAEVRKVYSQAIAGGVDEVDFDKLTTEEIRKQWTLAREQAGSKYIITPGCSVPDASTDVELARMPLAVGVKLNTAMRTTCPVATGEDDPGLTSWAIFSRPSGTTRIWVILPRTGVLGYSQSSLRD
jgi:uroporphyrinogen decarboxylase